jgi:hypothetical protein
MVLCMENHSNTEANHSILCPFPWPRDHDKSATFVAAIRNSIQSSNSPADIIQRLIGSSELTEIEDVLSSVLATPSPETNSLDTAWTSKVLGVAIDVYRYAYFSGIVYPLRLNSTLALEMSQIHRCLSRMALQPVGNLHRKFAP